MNIIDAVKLALKTKQPISQGISEQFWISDMNDIFENLAVFEILSDDWDVVEDDLIEKKITPDCIRTACAKKKADPATAEAIIDALWPK